MIHSTLIDRTTGEVLGEKLTTHNVAVIVEDTRYDLIVGRQHVSATPEQVAALRELLNSPLIFDLQEITA